MLRMYRFLQCTGNSFHLYRYKPGQSANHRLGLQKSTNSVSHSSASILSTPLPFYPHPTIIPSRYTRPKPLAPLHPSTWTVLYIPLRSHQSHRIFSWHVPPSILPFALLTFAPALARTLSLVIAGRCCLYRGVPYMNISSQAEALTGLCDSGISAKVSAR